MSSDTEDDVQPPSGSRAPWIVAVLVLLVAAAFFGGRELGRLRHSPAAPTPAKAAPTRTEPAPAPVAAAPAPAPAEPARETRPRAPRKATPPPATAAPAAPTVGELHIDADVPGAIVFLDRVYLGTAPVVARGVSPGTHHLNASAEGYDGYSESIDVAAGPADITVRFKEIRLNETLDVVHRHTMGSCEGKLSADPQGIRYDTSNKGDAFSMKYSEIEVFEVDYLKKNLRLKRRGGKTWNFTTRTENADPLFVFHRNVDKVRVQVAGK